MAIATATASATDYVDGINTTGLESRVDTAIAALTNHMIRGVQVVVDDKARRTGRELDVIVTYESPGNKTLTDPYQVKVFTGRTASEVDTAAATYRTANPDNWYAPPVYRYINEIKPSIDPHVILQFYCADSSGGLNWDLSGGTTSSGAAAAPDRSVQFNNGGMFGGDASFLYDATNKTLELDQPNNIGNWTEWSGPGATWEWQRVFGTLRLTAGTPWLDFNQSDQHIVFKSGHDVCVEATTASTSPGTGALTVVGGFGVLGAAHIGSRANPTLGLGTSGGCSVAGGVRIGENVSNKNNPLFIASAETSSTISTYTDEYVGYFYANDEVDDGDVAAALVGHWSTNRSGFDNGEPIGVLGISDGNDGAEQGGNSTGVKGITAFGAGTDNRDGTRYKGVYGVCDMQGAKMRDDSVYLLGGWFQGIGQKTSNVAVDRNVYGVRGEADFVTDASFDWTAGYGGYFEATGIAGVENAYGVYATASGADTQNWAGWFEGSTKINGLVNFAFTRDGAGATLTRANCLVKQTAAGITTTLIASPIEGDFVGIRNDSGGNTTIGGNGNNIEGAATLSLADGESVFLVWDNTGSEWTIF